MSSILTSVEKEGKIDWEKIGLLEGLEPNDKSNMINIFDLAWIKLNKISNVTYNIETFMLPILRKIYTIATTNINGEVSKLKSENFDRSSQLEKVNSFLNSDFVFENSNNEYQFYKTLVDDIFFEYFKFICDDSNGKLIETPETVANNIDVEAENLAMFCDLYVKKIKKEWNT